VWNTVVTLMRQPGFAPYSRIWLDIVSAASHGARDHSAAGKSVIDGFSAGSKHGFPRGYPMPRPKTARLVLTLIEGTLVMDAVGHADTTDRASRPLRA
jgi:hypothetical protein